MTDPQLWQESFREGYVDAMHDRLILFSRPNGYDDGYECALRVRIALFGVCHASGNLISLYVGQS